MNHSDLAATTVRLLKTQYPDAECTLDFQTPWQLLVAAILAAQCTDARVNLITPALFARYPDPQATAAADRGEIESLIRTCGLFRAKAKAILGSASMLIENFGGELPKTIEELTRLPGVGRKIANLMLGDCFGIPAIVVDTHCARISRLIGLTDNSDPLKVEKDLAAVLPDVEWIGYGHRMVAHGREICLARRPDCPHCPLNGICRFSLQL